MKNYANATHNTRTLDRFEYYLSDIDCVYCANYLNRGAASRCGSHGCGRTKCEYQDLRDECIANGRIKRKKGWNRQCRE